MKEIADRYFKINQRNKEITEDKNYLFESLNLKPNEEPPVKAPELVKFQLANPFDERLKQITKENYTTVMTQSE